MFSILNEIYIFIAIVVMLSFLIDLFIICVLTSFRQKLCPWSSRVVYE